MKKDYTKGIIFFTAVFILMCVLKLWYTLLIIFTFAIVITMKNRKRNFCYNVCPLGIIQDSMEDKKKTAPKHNLKIVKRIFYTLFVIYIGVYVVYLYEKPFELWKKMFFLMIFSSLTALILQTIFGKRYWCINICPLGSVMNIELKVLRKLYKNK